MTTRAPPRAYFWPGLLLARFRREWDERRKRGSGLQATKPRMLGKHGRRSWSLRANVPNQPSRKTGAEGVPVSRPSVAARARPAHRNTIGCQVTPVCLPQRGTRPRPCCWMIHPDPAMGWSMSTATRSIHYLRIGECSAPLIRQITLFSRMYNG